MDIARSLMFVPGHRAHMIDRALSMDSLDVALLDIEDGVPPAEKDAARAQIAERLAARAANGPRLFVRVNAVSTDELRRDLDAAIRSGLDAIVLPKVESAAEVAEVERFILERERAQGMPPGSVRLVPSVESARGQIEAAAIANASRRVAGLMFGAEDYANDLGLPTDRQSEARELAHARAWVVVAATAARVDSYDGVWPDIRDIEGLRRDSLLARRLGFTGKTLIHPSQVEVVNDVFTPSDAEAANARRVVEASEAAAGRGDGAIALDGQLIDRPVVERARRVIRLWEAARAKRGASSATTTE